MLEPSRLPCLLDGCVLEGRLASVWVRCWHERRMLQPGMVVTTVKPGCHSSPCRLLEHMCADLVEVHDRVHGVVAGCWGLAW